MQTIPVTVYHVGPSCVQCTQTKRMMDKLGIAYAEVDLRERPDLVSQFSAQGYVTAPIVTAGGQTWSGFRHSMIVGLGQRLASRQDL